MAVVVLSRLANVLKDYRQRLLNTQVMLALRRSLFDRLLHLPLPTLWDMKTGGILSRITGDVDTTTGLLQLAIISPSISVVRLLIAVVVLFSLNWRLALTALAIIPGIICISFMAARRVRPIYRMLRKDVERIDGRVGETFSGIRVVRAFRREALELLEFLRGRHTVLRKELFAQRREMVIWASWGLLLGAVNVVIVWYGGYLNLLGRASVGDIMAFQWYTFLLLSPVWSIVNSFSELQRSLSAMERVFDVLGMEEDKPDPPDAVQAPLDLSEMRFEGVTFEYREGAAGGPGLRRGGAGRVGRRPGGPQRRRQDHGDGPGGAVPRPDCRPYPAEREGHPLVHAAVLSRSPRHRPAGRLPVRRVRARTTSPTAGTTPPTRRSRTRRAARTPTSSSTSCRSATTPSWASAA